MPDGTAVFLENESDIRISQGGERQIMLNMRGLGFFRPQKFPAGGQIIEELPDVDASAGGDSGGLHFGDGASVDNNLRALGGIAVPFPGGEAETADAGDTWYRFAAKSHGGDGGQILGALNLAGGMPFQAKQRVIAAHAGAVIGHPDQAASAGLDLNANIAGAGVQGVLNEFFHDTGGTLNHFAGGDLVGHLFR